MKEFAFIQHTCLIKNFQLLVEARAYIIYFRNSSKNFVAPFYSYFVNGERNFCFEKLAICKVISRYTFRFFLNCFSRRQRGMAKDGIPQRDKKGLRVKCNVMGV